MSTTKKFFATALLLVAQSLPLWAQTTAPAPAPTVPPVTDKAADPRAPVTQAPPIAARPQVVNTTVAAPTPEAKKPTTRFEQDKALWGGGVPMPDLKFEGF